VAGKKVLRNHETQPDFLPFFLVGFGTVPVTGEDAFLDASVFFRGKEADVDFLSWSIGVTMFKVRSSNPSGG